MFSDGVKASAKSVAIVLAERYQHEKPKDTVLVNLLKLLRELWSVSTGGTDDDDEKANSCVDRRRCSQRRHRRQ